MSDAIKAMSEPSRRAFLATTTAVAGVVAVQPAKALPAATPSPGSVPLTWLDGHAPLTPAGVAFGVPWPRGTVSRKAHVQVRDGAGRLVPTQAWPMAYWPDGSIKWTGMALAADSRTDGLSVSVTAKAPARPGKAISVREEGGSVLVDTGAVVARIDRTGANLISSLSVQGREVARAGRLIAIREDRTNLESEGVRRDVAYASDITKVTVEQSGPIRAVVRIDGQHRAQGGPDRRWLPFVVRFYFTAGLASIRMVHSFVFDGDQSTDFIKALGLSFSIPFREEIQNRHVRFATDDHNLFSEPVMLAPGYRPKAMANAAAYERAQMQGQRIPNLDALPAADRANLLETPTWDSFKLNQLTADSWELTKRTNAKSSWLRITGGRRARGFAFLGDVSGGLGVSLKRFWQKCPAGFEAVNASQTAGELKVWFWSPDAQPMDLRHYDTVGHALDVVYEDYEEGHADAHGAANTSELTLWATAGTPDPDTLDAMADTGASPPLLICAPAHYHLTQTLGQWSLPNTPVQGLTEGDLAAAETQLDRAFRFFSGEIDRRGWYGFWDFGDFKRTYDPIRNQWMYDIGGHGWNATELMPNVWLWFAFLRSGRADIFRAAEDMTRNTLEVDVHHIGRFAGLGSRHNVSHWGCGAKEARINIAFMKRFHYYLTTDERTGDLMREPLDVVEASLANIPPLRKVSPRPDIAPPKAFIRIGPDWLTLASHWMAEWERTGDAKYRGYLLTGMRDIGAMPDVFATEDGYAFDPATKHLKAVGQPNKPPGQFMFLFAGDQVAQELITLIDCPEFARAWTSLCERFVAERRVNWYFEPRLTAQAAMTTGRRDLQEKAIALYRDLLKFDGQDRFLAEPIRLDGPSVAQPAWVNPGTSTFTPAIATPEISQWAINLMTAPELLRQFKPKGA